MGKTTGITWANATWNPWYGCTKVSSGCANCYAEREMTWFGKDFNTITRSKTTFRDPLKWKTPKIIFVNSWSDFFHPDVPLHWVDDAWDIMMEADHHIYLLLTKRANNIKDALPLAWHLAKPPAHIWIGVTVEEWEYAHRLVALEEIQASIKFVSIEPFLGPMPLLNSFFPSLDWVITGGESDPDPRPCNLNWVRDVRDQCIRYNIPFHHKQHGGSEKIDGTWGGRELDGIIWDQMPPNRIRGENGG